MIEASALSSRIMPCKSVEDPGKVYNLMGSAMGWCGHTPLLNTFMLKLVLEEGHPCFILLAYNLCPLQNANQKMIVLKAWAEENIQWSHAEIKMHLTRET